MSDNKSLSEIIKEQSNSRAVIEARKTIVANRLKLLRIEKGLQHSDVAKGTNITKLTYSGYENAHNNTPIEALVRLAIFYNVSLDYICGRTDNKLGCYVSDEGETQAKQLSELTKRIEELEQKSKP